MGLNTPDPVVSAPRSLPAHWAEAHIRSIRAVNGQAVETLAELATALEGGGDVTLSVTRGAELRDIHLP